MLEVLAPLKSLFRKIVPYFNFVISRGFVRVPIIGGDGLQLLYIDRYEPWMRTLFHQLFLTCGPNKRIALIDIGANIGQTLLSAMTSIDDIFYIGVEPNPRCLAYLVKLRELNDFRNCHFISAPCGKSVKLSSLHFNPSDTSPGGSLLANLRGDNSSTIHCMPVSVEEIIRTFDLFTYDLIILKIDAEGLEYDILNSISVKTFKSLNILIVVEVLPHVLQEKQKMLAEWCHVNGLRIFKIDTDVGDKITGVFCDSFAQSDSYSESESNYILLPYDSGFI